VTHADGREMDHCGGIVVVHQDGTVLCSTPECAVGTSAKSHALFASCSEITLDRCELCDLVRSR